MSETFIYIMSAKNGDDFVAPTKIGIAGNPHKRLSSIRTASPIDVHLMLALPVATRTFARAIERSLHEALKPHWLRGEWFSACPVDCGIAVCTFINMGYEHLGAKDPELTIYLTQSGVIPVMRDLLDFRNAELAALPAEGSA